MKKQIVADSLDMIVSAILIPLLVLGWIILIIGILAGLLFVKFVQIFIPPKPIYQYQAEFIKDYVFPDYPTYAFLIGCKTQWFYEEMSRIMFDDFDWTTGKVHALSKGIDGVLIFDCFDLDSFKKMQEDGYIILRFREARD